MTGIRINKVALNIGAGGEGDSLQKAEQLLTEIAEQKPVRTYAKKTISEWGIKKKAQIGVKVTLRAEKARKFLERAFSAVENQVKFSQFDREGNLSFGVEEYIELPGAKYDPGIGMFGLDVSVHLEKIGYRVGQKQRRRGKLPARTRITPEEASKFFQENFKVKVVME